MSPAHAAGPGAAGDRRLRQTGKPGARERCRRWGRLRDGRKHSILPTAAATQIRMRLPRTWKRVCRRPPWTIATMVGSGFSLRRPPHGQPDALVPGQDLGHPGDPRGNRTRLHNLMDFLVLSVICGADGFVAIAAVRGGAAGRGREPRKNGNSAAIEAVGRQEAPNSGPATHAGGPAHMARTYDCLRHGTL